MRPPTPGQSTAFTEDYPAGTRTLTTPVRLGAHLTTGQAWPPSPSADLIAIWDTGATRSVITRRLVQAVGLRPISLTTCTGVSGSFETSVYLVSLLLPNGVCLPQLEVVEADLGGPEADMLIGRDVIGEGDFAVSNFGGKTTLSFRLPAVERLDFVATEGGADRR